MLTLTATPIPRTLAHVAGGHPRLLGDRHRAAAAARDQDLRRAANRAGMVREAVLRELKRGGQVYFLHNEVETIENRRDAAGGAAAGGAHRDRPRPDARSATSSA
ncbi:MAG: hypothetical protein MZW92_43360 [Comamonadaceae bacterium]|nr:hypothetical protein [Comamonadaceae bacterium]